MNNPSGYTIDFTIPQGITGPTGATGVQGIQGDIGPTGATHTLKSESRNNV